MAKHTYLSGIIVEETTFFTIDELCHTCGTSAEWVHSLVAEGVIEPQARAEKTWRFHGQCLRRVRIVQRLETDLGLNLAGAALALELLEEVSELRSHLAALEKQSPQASE